jgi:hypothetical protein
MREFKPLKDKRRGNVSPSSLRAQSRPAIPRRRSGLGELEAAPPLPHAGESGEGSWGDGAIEEVVFPSGTLAFYAHGVLAWSSF